MTMIDAVLFNGAQYRVARTLGPGLGRRAEKWYMSENSTAFTYVA